MYTHTIKAEEEGIRLDKKLTELNKEYSRQQIQLWIKEKNVTVNGQRQKPNYKCKENDKIEWEIPKKEPLEIKAEPIPLHILYEDNNLIVLNKPKGMLVHPTNTVTSGTLVNALKYHCSELSDVGGEDRPGIVHRLDKDTSGVLVAAKNNDTHLHLKEQFKNKTVKRIYEAICFGGMNHTKGVIKAPIGRNPTNRLQMAVVPDGKEAETHFHVLERFKQYTHVECELKTGRTHQIRVHLKYMNHPIVGDELYCRKKTSLIKGQALFSKQLNFINPKTGEIMDFSVEQPQEFESLLQRLRNMS